MGLTQDEYNDYVPDIWFGDKNIKDIDTSHIVEDEDEEPDPNAKASPYVIAMLGFDPDELEEE